jgi:FkbM family methyltransferase
MTDTADFFLASVEPHIRTEGRMLFEIDGRRLDINLQHPHERAYAAKLLFKAKHPQSDVDAFLLQRFVRPGDAVLDAGANIGFTAIEMLQAGARTVLAVEPVPSICQRLRSIEGRGVRAINRAISSNIGNAPLILSTLHNQGSSLKKEITEVFPTVFGETHQTVEVQLTTIDLLTETFGHLDVWKLDVEGAEADALRGAKHTLSTNPPRVIIAELYDRFYDEFHQLVLPTHPFAYRAFITREGYELVLKDPSTQPTDEMHHTSPMYVFLAESATNTGTTSAESKSSWLRRRLESVLKASS